ncbi:hypothetical protein H4Q26_018151 [Puccinia striiformis f. sp. tritici PST-130]|nr:hypothetical protein H4Q26_018151 [Puccinia striiformis f. sp. tritici PST-130]
MDIKPELSLPSKTQSSAVEINHLSINPITAHAFNGDRTQLAVCENSNKSRYTRNQKLNLDLVTLPLLGHRSIHSAIGHMIDWAPRRNQIVTASQDRNAYVWQYGTDPLDQMKQNLRWSGARAIAVCQYDEIELVGCQTSQETIKITVLSIAWHPNSVLLAAGSADATCRVLSAYIKGVDSKPTATVWGERIPFNTICGDFLRSSGGWVHDWARYSPPWDSCYQLPSLPFISLSFTSEDSFVAAGHDCQPMVFQGNLQQGWRLIKTLDEENPQIQTNLNANPQEE